MLRHCLTFFIYNAVHKGDNFPLIEYKLSKTQVHEYVHNIMLLDIMNCMLNSHNSFIIK